MQELNIADTAKRLGISIDTVRRRIRSGELRARKVKSPHGDSWLVELPDEVLAVAEASAANPAIDGLLKTISILESELEARKREIQELHILLRQSQAALPPGRGVARVHWWQRLFPWTRAENQDHLGYPGPKAAS